MPLRQIRIRSKLKRCTAPNTAYKNCLFRRCQVAIGSLDSSTLSKTVGSKQSFEMRRVKSALSEVLIGKPCPAIVSRAATSGLVKYYWK